MAYVQGPVVEPDVGLNADCAYLQGRVEGDFTPVVIVRVLGGLRSAVLQERMDCAVDLSHLQRPWGRCLVSGKSGSHIWDPRPHH